MKTSDGLKAALARVPADGLEHNYDRPQGAVFDYTKSAAVRWIISQPEILQWVWDTFRDRGWMVYDGAKWRAGDAEQTRVAARAGRAGAAAAVRSALSPELLVRLLEDADGAMTWTEWKKAAEVAGGVKMRGGPWAFYHAIKPLLTAGRVVKHGGKYKLAHGGAAAPAPAPAWSLTSPPKIDLSQYRTPERAALLWDIARHLKRGQENGVTLDEWRARSGMSEAEFEYAVDPLFSVDDYDKVIGNYTMETFFLVADIPAGGAPASTPAEVVDL